jgi:phospholipid/cholesterol/gamma-HCH transport system substrate-binding protein
MARGATARVGMLVLGAVLVLMAGMFMIGEQNRIFTSKNRYTFTIASAGGLNEGNPVRLDGVTVGLVERITLPEDPRQQLLTVRISIEKQYEQRIRADSTAKIRTLGLLGDKFVEVNSGAPEKPIIAPGGVIPTAAATDVDQLLASGGDVVDNLVRISYSLNSILGRIDRGEGLIGELTTGESEDITQRVDRTLASAERVMADVEAGRGPLGLLLRDQRTAERLGAAVADLETLMASATRGEGMVASVLRDPDTRADFDATLAEARATAEQLRRWTAEIEQGNGLVDRLLTDPGMGERVSRDLEGITTNLREVAEKLNRGEGTAAKIINDPNIYDAVNDIIVGIDESPILRWLIRNRQKTGIEKRYEAESGGARPPREGEVPEEPPTGPLGRIVVPLVDPDATPAPPPAATPPSSTRDSSVAPPAATPEPAATPATTPPAAAPAPTPQPTPQGAPGASEAPAAP